MNPKADTDGDGGFETKETLIVELEGSNLPDAARVLNGNR